MDQRVDIEDIVIPFRTYAWAITGSISKADQLVMKCFKGLACAATETLPTTKMEWFEYIDRAVVDWIASEDEGDFPNHRVVAKTIKVIANVQPAILYRLLAHSRDLPNDSDQLLSA